jgi:hypothetical protein
MRILHIQPAIDRGGGHFRDVATFDVQINEGLRILGLRLVEGPGGKRLVYSPSKHGRKFATFGADYAQSLAAAATAALGGYEANEDKR